MNCFIRVMTRIVLSVVLSVGFAVLVVGSSTRACIASGELDPTFGSGGKVETGFGHHSRPMDSVLQPDGKLVVVGSVEDFVVANTVFLIVRYRPDGTLDPGFGSGGSVRIVFTDFISSANAVAIQPDGRIIVAGNTQSADGRLNQFALARLMPNGSPDPGFGTGGKLTTDFFGPPPHPGGFRESADVVLLQPDGKILVGGIASNNPDLPPKTALARYNSNGTLDTTFGTGGLVAVNAIGNTNALALLTDGRILALNSAGAPAQFSASGVLAPGVTPGPIATSAHTGTSMFQPNGYILVAKTELELSEHDIDVRVIRLNPTGGSDPTFSRPAFDFGAEDFAGTNAPQAIAFTPGHEIVVAGYSNVSFSQVFGLAALNFDGSFDAGFGSGGRLTTSFTGSDQVLAVSVQTDGKVIAVGQTFSAMTGLTDFALARYIGPAGATGVATSGDSGGESRAEDFVSLRGNPVTSGGASLHFGLVRADRVIARIYDVGGRSIASLADGPFLAGEHDLAWDGYDDQHRRVPAGVYFARFNYGSGFETTRRLVIMQ